MNKYVAWIMCGVLTLGAMLFSNTKTVVAGKGNGKSEKVDTVQEVGMVLNSLGEDLRIDRVFTTEGTDGISLLNTENGTNSTLNVVGKYKSVTLKFNTIAGTKAISGFNSSSVDMEKEMECYLTQKEAYYVIDALIKSSATVEGKQSGATISLACELYVTARKAIMRITRYSAAMVNGEAPEMPSGVLNKWVDMKGEASSIISVNDDNYEVMAVIGNYILETGSEKFKKSGNTYELGNLWAQQLCGEILGVSTSGNDNAFKKAEFSVDLSSKTSPYLTLLYSMHEDYGYGESKYNMEAGQYMTCRLSNINNTQIEFPENVKIYDISDFE